MTVYLRENHTKGYMYKKRKHYLYDRACLNRICLETSNRQNTNVEWFEEHRGRSGSQPDHQKNRAIILGIILYLPHYDRNPFTFKKPAAELILLATNECEWKLWNFVFNLANTWTLQAHSLLSTFVYMKKKNSLTSCSQFYSPHKTIYVQTNGGMNTNECKLPTHAGLYSERCFLSPHLVLITF